MKGADDLERDAVLTAAQRLDKLNSSEPATLTEAVTRLLPQIEESLRQRRTYPEILAELKSAGIDIKPKSFGTFLFRARANSAKRLAQLEPQTPFESTVARPSPPPIRTTKDIVTPQNDTPLENAERIIRPKPAHVIEHNDAPSLKDFI